MLATVSINSEQEPGSETCVEMMVFIFKTVIYLNLFQIEHSISSVGWNLLYGTRLTATSPNVSSPRVGTRM